eukprot:12627556-Ditylum_brightwellii.AAC.1
MANPHGTNITAQPILQNHTISPSQNTPQRMPQMKQQQIFQIQPESIKHEMDLGANARDQLIPMKMSQLEHIIQTHIKQILHHITPSLNIPL